MVAIDARAQRMAVFGSLVPLYIELLEVQAERMQFIVRSSQIEIFPNSNLVCQSPSLSL